MVGDRFPKIVDVVRLSRGADIVIDCTHFITGIFVFD
jgi:hypothetical protein